MCSGPAAYKNKLKLYGVCLTEKTKHPSRNCASEELLR